MSDQTPIPAEALAAADEAAEAAYRRWADTPNRSAYVYMEMGRAARAAAESAFAAGLAAGRTAAAEDPAVQRVIAAAKVWRTARNDRISGDVLHHACKALDQAVAALIGELDGEPLAPPTEDDFARGRALVAAAKERSDRWWAARVVEKGANHAH